jgi:fatty-acid desaturase
VFPTSAFHGLSKAQFDASGLMIRAWEKMGWVTQVRRPTGDQILRKLGRGD